MKKTRLLEIVREEIAFALNEMTVVSPTTPTSDIPIISKSEKVSPDAVKSALDQAKKSGKPVNVAETELEEEQLNEEPDFGGQFDKKVAAKYGEEDTLEAATEKITNRVLSDKGITKADVAKMDKKELDSLLKDIRAFISQKKQTPEVAAALKKQTEFDDSGSKLQDNQTNKAILRALGFGTKKGPKGPTKNKEEKPKAEKSPKAEKASKAEPKAKETKKDSEEDKAATAAAKADKAIGSKYAKELSPEEETKYSNYKKDITDLVNQLEKKYDRSKMEELKLYLEDSEVRNLFKSKGVKLSDLVRSVIR